MRMLHFLAAATAAGAIAVPAAAQSVYSYQSYPVQQAYPYQQTYPYQQSYPGYQQGYAQQGYQQGYGYPSQSQTGTSVIGQIVDSLLGNSYSVTDRTAVSQCATAAMAQASARYSGYGQQGYGYDNRYAQQGYNQPAMRVTAITGVKRGGNGGLRVTGLMSSGAGYAYGSHYGGQYGYQNRGYAQGSDLSFRCNVAYNGAVSGIHINRASAAYRG